MAHRSHEIAKRVPHDRPIFGVEVGVRYGKNAEHLLTMLPNLTLWLVDPWRKPPPGDQYYQSGDGIADRPPGHFRKCLKETLRRINPFDDRCDIFVMTSEKAARYISNLHPAAADVARYPSRGYPPQFDFVFLDADHSYEGIRQDITLWWPLVAPGGLLCGHDYNHPQIGEVKRAVDELFDNSDHTE